jgi:hypothetical protein
MLGDWWWGGGDDVDPRRSYRRRPGLGARLDTAPPAVGDRSASHTGQPAPPSEPLRVSWWPWRWRAVRTVALVVLLEAGILTAAYFALQLVFHR